MLTQSYHIALEDFKYMTQVIWTILCIFVKTAAWTLCIVFSTQERKSYKLDFHFCLKWPFNNL